MWMIVTKEQAVIGTQIEWQDRMWEVRKVKGPCPVNPDKLVDVDVRLVRSRKKKAQAA